MTRITIKDVAASAGVSISAVSRAFSPGGSVSDQTRQKVLDAADHLGYRPNFLARGLAKARTGLVALVVGETRSPFDTQFTDVLATHLMYSGRRMLLAPIGESQSADEGAMLALDYQADAAVIAAGTMSQALSGKFARLGIPVILSGRVVDSPGVDCVLADNMGGARDAAKLFLRHGRTRIAYLGRDHGAFSDLEREKGLEDALAEEGLELFFKETVPGHEHHSYITALRMLNRRNPPDAVLCMNDALAMGVIEAAVELGIRIPRDLAVIGFDDIPMASWPSFRLSTIRYPLQPTVERIVDFLEARLDDPGGPPMVERIPTELVLRDTTPRLSRIGGC